MQKIFKNYLPILAFPRLGIKKYSNFLIKRNKEYKQIYLNIPFVKHYSSQTMPGNFQALNTKMNEIVNNKITESKELLPFLESLEKFGGFFKLANTPLPFNQNLLSSFFNQTVDAMCKFDNPNELYISGKVLVHLAKNEKEAITKLIDLLASSDLIFGIKKSNLTDLLLSIHQLDQALIKKFYSGFLLQIQKYAEDMKFSNLIYFLGYAHSFLDSIGISEEERKIFVSLIEKNPENIPNLMKTLDSDNLVRLLALSHDFLTTNKDQIIKSNLDFIAKYYESIHISQIVKLLEILTSMNYGDEDLWYHLAEILIIKIHSLNSFQLIKVLNCFSFIGYTYNPLLEEVVDKLALRVDDIDPKDIPLLAHSLSLTKTKGDHLIENLHAKIKGHLKLYSTKEIVTLFTAASYLNSTNEALCIDMENELVTRIPEITIENLESLANGLIYFNRYGSDLFKPIAEILSVELDNNSFNSTIDEAVMAVMFGITKNIKSLEVLLDRLIDYCNVRMDQIGINDIHFVMNLGGMLGMHTKVLSENEKFRNLGKIFLEKVVVYRDLHRDNLKSDILSALQSMIFSIKNEVFKSRK